MIGRRWRRAGPWATPILVVGELTLVSSGLIAVRAAVVVGVLVEAILGVIALVRARAALSRYRTDRAGGVGVWAAAEDGLALLVPRTVARALLVEPRLLVCLVRWATRHHEGRSPGTFGYHHNVRGLLAAVVAVVLCEGAIVEVFLDVLLPGTPWVWLALAVHAYGLIWLLGLSASFVTRPHRVGADSLFVRDGIFTELEIPYEAIAGARLSRRPNFGRSGLKFDPEAASATLAVGDANVVIDLDSAVTIHHNDTHGLHLRTLHITADNPAALVQSLRADQPRPLDRTA